MVIASTPTTRRLQLTTFSKDMTIPHCQTSPVSMRYSVQGAGKLAETMSHNSHNELENRKNESQTIQWNIWLLLGMCLCSALFSMISLQFYFSNTEKHRGKGGAYRNYVDVVKDIIHSFDIAIVACSIASFFISAIQLLFLIKIVKQQSTKEISLAFISQTSFLRIVTYSFWFASILIFVAILLLNCAIDPSRSLASKCVSITLGISAILLCIWFSCKSLYFWGRLACGHIYKDNYYNLSTLV